MTRFVKITGLWKNTSKNNQEYLSGKLDGFGKIYIMENTRKKAGETYPDYFMYKSAPDDAQSTVPTQQAELSKELPDIPF